MIPYFRGKDSKPGLSEYTSDVPRQYATSSKWASGWWLESFFASTMLLFSHTQITQVYLVLFSINSGYRLVSGIVTTPQADWTMNRYSIRHNSNNCSLFQTRSDQSWGLPAPLLQGFWWPFFLPDEATVSLNLTISLHLTSRLIMSGATPPHTHTHIFRLIVKHGDSFVFTFTVLH